MPFSFKDLFTKFNKDSKQKTESEYVPYWQRHTVEEKQASRSDHCTASNLNPDFDGKFQNEIDIASTSRRNISDETDKKIFLFGTSIEHDLKDKIMTDDAFIVDESFGCIDMDKSANMIDNGSKQSNLEVTALDIGKDLEKRESEFVLVSNEKIESVNSCKNAVAIIQDKAEPTTKIESIQDSEVDKNVTTETEAILPDDEKKRYTLNQMLEMRHIQEEELTILGIAGTNDEFLCRICDEKMSYSEVLQHHKSKTHISNNKQKFGTRSFAAYGCFKDCNEKKTGSGETPQDEQIDSNAISTDADYKVVTDRICLINRVIKVDKNLTKCVVCDLLLVYKSVNHHISDAKHIKNLCRANLKLQHELIVQHPKVFDKWLLNDLYYDTNRIFIDPAISMYAYCGLCQEELQLNLKDVENHVSSKRHDQLLLLSFENGQNNIDRIIAENDTTQSIAEKTPENSNISKVNATDDFGVDELVKFLGGVTCEDSAVPAVTEEASAKKAVKSLSDSLTLARFVNENWGCKLANGSIACLICNILGLSGHEQVSAHFSSIQHKKIADKLTGTDAGKSAAILHENCISATYDIHPVIYQCRICKDSKPTVSLSDTMDHISNDEHLQNKDMWRHTPNNLPLLYAKIQPNKYSTVKLWCFTCKKAIENIQCAFQHITDAPHHPNTMVDHISCVSYVNIVYNCVACMVTINGNDELDKHYYSSQEHRQKRIELNDLIAATKAKKLAQIPVLPPTSTEVRPQVPIPLLSIPMLVPPLIQNINRPRIPFNHLTGNFKPGVDFTHPRTPFNDSYYGFNNQGGNYNNSGIRFYSSGNRFNIPHGYANNQRMNAYSNVNHFKSNTCNNNITGNKANNNLKKDNKYRSNLDRFTQSVNMQERQIKSNDVIEKKKTDDATDHRNIKKNDNNAKNNNKIKTVLAKKKVQEKQIKSNDVKDKKKADDGKDHKNIKKNDNHSKNNTKIKAVPAKKKNEKSMQKAQGN